MISRIKRYIKKLNPDVDLSTIDFKSLIDPKLTFEENLDILKENYPHLFPEEPHVVDISSQAEEDLLNSLNGEPKLDFQEVHNYLKEYNVHAEHYTYSSLFALMDNLTIINYGGSGTGKSRATVELFKKLDVPKVAILSGYFTLKGFIKVLKQYNGYCIVFDDADLILQNKDIANYLKTLLTNKKVYYITSKGVEEFTFNGSIILNVNEYKFGKFIEDKVFLNELSLSTKQIKDKIKAKDFREIEEIWEMIRNRIVYARHHSQVLTKKEEALAKNYVLSLPYLYSVRIYDKFCKILLGLKNLYGCIDREIFDFAKELLSRYTKLDEIEMFLSEREEISRKELTERIAQAKSISIRQARNIVRKMIEDGLLYPVNRRILRRNDV